MSAADGLALPVRVCFVCLGNICRSPMAAAVLRAKAADAGVGNLVTVGSAGTGSWHIGEPADPRAQAALARRGYVSGHVARQFRVDEFDRWDLILTMDRNNAYDVREMAPQGSDPSKVRLLLAFDPSSSRDAQVPDPYHGDDAEFDHVLDLLEAACDGLLAALQTGTPRA